MNYRYFVKRGILRRYMLYQSITIILGMLCDWYIKYAYLISQYDAKINELVQ